MENHLFVTELAREAIIHLDGRKIEDFLQGQLTCDLRQLRPDAAIHGALCSVKGRVLSDLWVLKLSDERCMLRLRRSLAQSFAEHLARFAQFSRIKVTLDAQEPAVFGIYSEEPERLPLEAPGACRTSDGALLLRSGPAQAQVILSSTDSGARDPITQVLAAMNCTADAEGTEDAWRAEGLRWGHYALEADDSERFTPQALNYDERGLVSFQKGCYTGQEVVARLHYKGKSKQRLQVFETPAGCKAETGGSLFLDEISIGTVLRRETALSGESIVAAMVAAQHRDKVLTTKQGEKLIPVRPVA
ncbi:MAG: folate-binding protein [Pseudomonadota bacterium]